MERKLGKDYPKFDKDMLHFSNYATKALPAPPVRRDWTRGFNIDWNMFLNDRLGICVGAAEGHALQTITLDNGRMSTLATAIILQQYENVGGYVPGDPSTDNGENEVDALRYWQRNGMGGFKLDAYAGIRLKQFDHVAQCINLMGGTFAGFQVPQSALDQNAAGQIWDVVKNDGGIVGGHAVWVPMYDMVHNVLTCITWGMRQMMTWRFWMKYMDESYALKVAAWENARGVAPSGFLPAQWDADVSQLQLAA